MTPHNFPLSDEIRRLDPAPTTDLTAKEIRRHDELLRLVLAETKSPRSSKAAIAARRWRPRRLVTSVAVVACVALLGAAALVGLPGGTHAPVSSYALPAHGSLASWTPTAVPATVSPAEVAACATELGFAGGGTPVVLTSDLRGDFTSVFIEQGASDGYCVLAGGTVENSINFEGLQAHPLADPNAAVISVVQGGSWMFVVSGHTGPNVRQLTVKNPETGQAVTAAVAKGVWSAWWPVGPGSPAWSSASAGRTYLDQISITYRTSDGASHVSSEMSDDPIGDASDVPSAPVVLGSLAGWAPDSKLIAASAADVDACGAAGGGWQSGSATTIVADTRGSYESLLVEFSGDEVYCVLKGGVVQWSSDHASPADFSAVPPGAAAITDGAGLDYTDGLSRISELQGYAGSDVTSVTLHLAEGHEVEASVQNGEWMAWWPENEPPALGGPTPTPIDGTASAAAPTGPPPFSWTTSDGVTHDSTP